MVSLRKDLALLAALLFVGSGIASPQASAKKSFAKKENVRCIECHDNKNGGGPRNLVGLYYHATKTLLDDRTSPAATQKMQREVNAWLDVVAKTPPEIVWRYTPLEELESVEPAPLTPASDFAVLRRLSLDLRGAPPRTADVSNLLSGRKTLEDITDEYLESEDFSRTFRLYHSDLVRPRTGLFSKSSSLTKIASSRKLLVGKTVWRHPGIKNDECKKPVQVSPYWARKSKIWVCPKSAKEDRVVNGQRCDTERGQRSGQCGCGPHMAFCYPPNSRAKVKRSMLQEGARLAMYVVENDRPYSEILTADYTMMNGRLEHHYARLDGTLGELEDADTEKRWRRVDVDEKNSGILSTHSYLNFFYNGRRWAQRTFESFMCHETTPDYELLDENPTEVPVSYRRHPTAEPDINVNSGRACAACHVQLDGLSRAKDRWDNHGQYYDLPIAQNTMFLDEETQGLDGFGKTLANSNVFNDCAVQQVWKHFMGHRFTEAETQTRLELNEEFKAQGQRFKSLLRAVVRSPEYRSKRNIKLMTRELYWRSMERVTNVKWTVGNKRGFDVFYDKVGGMDYRKIEQRDRTPSQGHSLVQLRGATETCAEAMRRDEGVTPGQRKMLSAAGDLSDSPEEETLDAVLEEWFVRLLARPYRDVNVEDKRDLKALFREVEQEAKVADAYAAMCIGILGAEDFALY